MKKGFDILNPEKKPLTIETLRTFPSCENLTDEEAENAIKTIEMLTIVAFHVRAKLLDELSKKDGILNSEKETNDYD